MMEQLVGELMQCQENILKLLLQILKQLNECERRPFIEVSFFLVISI
jgi:hypothetical protein